MSKDKHREYRRLNLELLVSKAPSRLTYAKRLGYHNVSYLNQLISGHSGIGAQTAKRIESVEDLPSGWLTQPHAEAWQEAGIGGITTSLSSNRKLFESLTTAELIAAMKLISTILYERTRI